VGQLEIPRRKWWHPVAIRVNYGLCQIRFVKYVFVFNTFCVQYVLCPIRFVSNTFCVQYPVQYVLCPIRFVSNMFCVQIRFVSNTFCVQYVLCPILLQWNTSAMAILMQYFCVKIPLFQICFVSLLVPVCFSVTSRLIGNADDLPPLYFSILFNTFQYFSILFNTFQYFSILFNTFQYFSHQVVQYFQKNEELQVLNSGRQTTTTSSPASTPGFTYRSTNTMDGMHPDR
jgi:hypothetical protein